jgi:hypothetical protein
MTNKETKKKKADASWGNLNKIIIIIIIILLLFIKLFIKKTIPTIVSKNFQGWPYDNFYKSTKDHAKSPIYQLLKISFVK